MARRRSNALSTAVMFVVGYEVGAFAWNWYQNSMSGPTLLNGFLLPLDGIGALIGYPGTGQTGLLTGGTSSSTAVAT
jgi:hypothetical protein